MRSIYFGSPDIAVPPLEALVAAGLPPVAVVTRPDRPAGRRRQLTPPPVKVAAERLGVPVLQPLSLRRAEVLAALAALQPDVGIVVAYGAILKPAVLAMPRYGILNIHPSLLPLHRGPAPVTGAILAGDTTTGVSIMQLDEGMDSGPLLAQATVPLAPTARAGALTDELMRVGADLLLEALPRYVAGAVVPQPQQHSLATYTRMISKQDGAIDWSLPALVIERMTRAYDPWPAAFTAWQGQPLKVLAATVLPDWTDSAPPGTVLQHDGDALVVTGSGALRLDTVQPASKRAMPARDWLRGQPGVLGAQLGRTSA